MRLKAFKAIATTLLLTALSFSVNAQEESEENSKFFHLTGNVLTENLAAIPYVHIILKNKNLATASDIHGYFNFPAETGDSILFSALGYKMKTMLVRDTFSVAYPYLEIYLEADTIQLQEIAIRPWQGNYERFKQAILEYEPPETDLDRAYKNLAIMDLHSLLYDSPATPSIAFKNTMKMYNDNLYWAGQLPPVNITNPLAWAQFFKALQNGDFKRK